MSMLEELWISGLDYQGRPVKKGSAMERKMCLYAKNAEKMEGMLTGPQAEQYEKLSTPSMTSSPSPRSKPTNSASPSRPAS